MPRFAANLSLLFAGQPFRVRLTAALACDYFSWVGCEYQPSGRSEASLDWLARWR